MTQTKQQPAAIASRFLGISLLLLVAAYLILLALQHAQLAPETHVDGPYQFYSSLLWKNSPLIYGRDYILYLGWGLVSSANLLFELTNQSLAASLFTEHLFHGLLFCAALILAIRAFFPTPGAVLIWLIFFIGLASFTNQGHLGSLMQPDHSDLGARMAISSLCIFGIYHLARSENRASSIACSLLLGLTPLWSNDFGPISAAWGAVLFALLSRHRPWRILKVGLGAAFTLAIALWVITQGHLLEWFTRTSGVSDYQYWYFPGYGHDAHIYSVEELLRRLANYRLPRNASLVLLVNFFILAMLARRGLNTKPYLALSCWLLATLSGAIVVEIFGHVYDRYYQPLDMAAYVGACLLLGRFTLYLWQRHGPNTNTARAGWRSTALLLIANGIVLAWSVNLFKYAAPGMGCITSQHLCDQAALQSTTFEQITRLKQDMVNEGVAPEHRLIGEYYTTLADLLEVKPVLPSALALHALGDKAQGEWIKALEETPFRYALTTDPAFSHFQFWSLHQEWWFYRRIIERFDPLFRDGQFIIWQRRPAEDQRHFTPSEAQCRITPETEQRWLLEFYESSPGELYEVVVETGGELAPRQFLQLAWQNPYGLEASRSFGSVAKGNRIRFPYNGEPASLVLERVGPPGPANIQPIDCRILSSEFEDNRDLFKERGSLASPDGTPSSIGG